jgi:hypothetical protein
MADGLLALVAIHTIEVVGSNSTVSMASSIQGRVIEEGGVLWMRRGERRRKGGRKGTRERDVANEYQLKNRGKKSESEAGFAKPGLRYRYTFPGQTG